MGPRSPQAGYLGPDIRRRPLCRLPICRGPLAVPFSGPAGSLPCREEWFGCSGIRNSKFQRRHPARGKPACQQFGIPNSIIGFTGGASETIRSVSGQAGAQPDRVAPPRPWNVRKGYLPAYLAAFPRGRCPAMLRPEARSDAGVRDGARQGGAIRPRVLCRPAAVRPGFRLARVLVGTALRTVAARWIPYRKLRRLKVLTRLRLSSSLHAGRITDIRSRNGCTSRPSGGT